jgi:glycerophosphoryl diester phosphodiesterase
LIKSIDPNISPVYEIGNISDYLHSEFHFNYILIGYSELAQEETTILKSMGTKIITFTPNSPTEYQIAIDNGCVAIMTDNPLLLRSYVSQTTSGRRK